MTGRRRRWTAEDYATIETLSTLRIPAWQIGAFLDPAASGQQVRAAARHAGITLGRSRGRPSDDERDAWDRLHRQFAASLREDAERRSQIMAFAASLGYTVVIRRLSPGQTS